MQGVDHDLTQQDEDLFERRLDSALATAPMPEVSPEFAARVAALVPAQRPLPAARARYARTIILLSVAALLVALFVLAPHATAGATFAIALEWVLCAQLSLIVLGIALPGSGLRWSR